MIADFAGERVVSDQTVWKVVQARACATSSRWQDKVSDASGPMPNIAEAVDIYSEEPEILMHSDAILVTRQKPKRVRTKRQWKDGNEDVSSNKKQDSKPFGSKRTASGRVSTDVAMVQRKSGGYQYLTSGIDENGKEIVSLVDMLRAFFRREYAADEFQKPLQVVAITDGASCIRSQLVQVFGFLITIILDWFHLCKKVREKMTMIARSKDEKISHTKQIVRHLWRGEVDEAKNYLAAQVVARNAGVRDDLLGYLDKHKSEIINYEKRRAVKKPIGSGRMEKGVDLIIGQRQKRGGMSWSDAGSKALAILTVEQLNGKWKPQIASE